MHNTTVVVFSRQESTSHFVLVGENNSNIWGHLLHKMTNNNGNNKPPASNVGGVNINIPTSL